MDEVLKMKIEKHFLNSSKNRRLERTYKIVEMLFEHPGEFMTVNFTALSKALGIPLSTVYDYWNTYIKGNVKIRLELK